MAELTVNGIKTATASAYPVYEYENCDLPKAGGFSVILHSDGTALCVIQTVHVAVVPFKQVTAEHAFKEGEGDRSLDYWKTVHKKVFSDELIKINKRFTDDMLVVCEEFKVVYPVKTE